MSTPGAIVIGLAASVLAYVVATHPSVVDLLGAVGFSALAGAVLTAVALIVRKM